VIILIGKLYILFKIKLFSKIKVFILQICVISILLVLLKNNSFCLNKIKNNKIIQIYEKVKKVTLKLIWNLNSSLEAIDVMYINKISIPPIKIKNKE